MGRFNGISSAKFNEGGIYFLKGNYLIRVDKVKVGTTRMGIEFFVVECTILESDNPERKPKSSVSWLCMSDKDLYLANINHFCSIACDIPSEEVDEAGVELVVSEENPLAGTILRVQATDIKTRAGKDFTKVVWKQPTVQEKAPHEKAA